MKVIQVSKRLNNDELGIIGNDTFISLPKHFKENVFDWRNIFFNQEFVYFINKRDTNEKIKLRYYENESKRWVKLIREFFQMNNLSAGDEVILEKRIFDDGEVELYIDFKRYEGVVFQASFFYDKESDMRVGGFECLKGDPFSFNEKYGNHISINCKGLFKRTRRKNSPFIKCFEINVDGEDIFDGYGPNDLIEIQIINNKIIVGLINRGSFCEMEV